MQKPLLTCAQWAEQTFGDVDLADCRRRRRLVKVAAALAGHPGGTLPGALPKWKDLKAAYRLLDNPSVTFEKLLRPQWRRVQSLCAAAGQYLVIEDTTLLDFTSHRSLRGIGRIGDDKGRGMFLHSSLAFRVEGWQEHCAQLSLLGLAGQHRWVRAQELTRGEGVPVGREPKKRKYSRNRESERWAKVLGEFAPPVPGNQRIYIADREGDMYELFGRCEAAGFDFVVRACQNRALVDRQEGLFAAVGKQAELGRYCLPLRGRPGSAARQAIIALRTARVVVRAPYRAGGRGWPREVVVVEACEVNPPNDKQAIHWVLLTSLECDTYAQARRIIGMYCCRWMIEEYHKALKTGAGIEQTQLQECRRVESLLAILSLVAVRLLDLKLQASENPQGRLHSDDIEPEALKILEAHFGLPPDGWTQRNLWISIARLGGFLARKSDGTPGWQTLWRGWSRLQEMTEGAKLHRRSCG